LSMAVIALVGPCYDIFISLQHEIENRFEARKKRQARDLPVEGN
jgi:hypothetical protein